ncbi:hypothetical protein BJY04DRAFT_224305 [Aspergillus karnatakaensis]|uniref:uncharacterized protein n=1 Tax=Aspergillus karnatakaensis TaxID=1810916 RepID=UPI003CCE1C3A
MKPTDPLCSLSVECASTVFLYLSAPELAHCERVSRAWRSFTRQWIASFGFRLHFPHARECNDSIETSAAVCIFKSQSRVRANIQRGQPSHVHIYPQTRVFLAAGDFCVYLRHNQGIFWARLSPRGGAALQPILLLDTVDALQRHHDPSELMVLGANGYLLVRSPLDMPPGTHEVQRYSDTLYCLEKGEQMWTHRSNDPRSIPLLVGEERVYFGRVTIGKSRSSEIQAYALDSGELLYQGETVEVIRSNCGFLDIRPHPFGIPLQLLYGAQDELLLVCKPHHATTRIVTINLINGADGTLHQKLLADVLKSPYIVRSSGRGAFALISRDEDASTLRIQTFCRQTNGQFTEASIDVVDLSRSLSMKKLAIDPFVDVVLDLHLPERQVRLSILEDPHNETLLAQYNAAFKPFFSPKKIDRCLITNPGTQISLPSSSGNANLPSSSPPNSGINRERWRILDSHRFLVNYKDHDDYDSWTAYILDFNPVVEDT